ncbi:hypothetical protein ACHAXS_010855 [Conticribra weissflogii]
MGSKSKSASGESSPVKLVSLGQGEMGRQLSWSDFQALQDRIETLERSNSFRRPEEEEAEGVEEGAPLFRKIANSRNGRDADDEKENVSIEDDGTYELPESTYTLIITENVCSLSFLAAVVACAIAMISLVIVLTNELDNGDADNPLGLPAGVNPEVRMAQFLGVVIGVLMEEEIPLGLEIIAHGLVAQKTTSGEKYSFNRIVMSSLLRLGIGYLFLLTLFLTVIQESDVLDIFFDVLALEFVETIDDVIYGLSKRGFFGRGLKVATNRTHCLVKASTTEATVKIKERLILWANRLIRLVYLFNGGLMIAGLLVLSIKQQNGDFRCQSMSVEFGDNLWEEAVIILDDGTFENRLLLYSHFSGIYVENGTHDGRPKYTEQNKERGVPFPPKSFTAKASLARIVGWSNSPFSPDFFAYFASENLFCDKIDDEAWVFRHERIRTSTNEENEKYPSLAMNATPLLNATTMASASNKNAIVAIKFGIHCEYDRPCQTIRCKRIPSNETLLILPQEVSNFLLFCVESTAEKSRNFTLELLGDKYDDEVNFVEVYGRPVYKVNNLQGIPYSVLRLGFPDDDDVHFEVQHKQSSTIEILPPHKHTDPEYFLDDDFFETNNRSTAFQKLLKNYTFVLRFTGRRWYGQISQPGLTSASLEEEEFHGFWNKIFSGTGEEDNSTLIISDPSLGGSPVGLDFFEMRRRNDIFEGGKYDYDYDPFGVLIPLVPYSGSGFFHCNIDN